MERLEGVRVSENGVRSFDDEVEQLGSSAKGSENLGVHLLDDLDSYWEAINERLIISRMVSDSVIKGMVNAVEQEAAEKIASKELEVASLKDSLHHFRVDPESINYGPCSSSIDVCVERDNMIESLRSLRNVVKEEFKKLKQEITGVKGCSSIRKIGSASELVGLGGILKEKESGGWICVDKTLGSLELVVDTMCSTVDDVVCLSNKSIQEWQQEHEFQKEVEAMVMQSSIRSIQEELEEKFWNQNASLFGNQSVNWLKKFDEISCLRKELDTILKFLPNQETGQLISHGSFDMVHSQRTLSNDVPFSPSLWEGNGNHDESKTGVPDKFDAAQFGHMKKQELVNFFNTTITRMRREHEHIVQVKTEQYYSLKAKYLTERGSSLLLKKDKESDVLRKKIPEVIMKLDDMLVEKEKFPAFNDESLGSLKSRLDNLLSENRQLRDALTDKKNEVKCLSSQVSDAGELVAKLNSSTEDANIEASIREDVYKCVLKELSGQIKSDAEESYRILLEESAQKIETTSECEIEDLDTESLIMQGLCQIIYGEAIKEAEEQVKEFYQELLIANEGQAKLEMEVLKKEKEVRLEVEEKEKLKQEVLSFETSLGEREKLSLEVLAELKNTKEQLEFTSEELDKLRDQTNSQQTLISESKKEIDVAKDKLVEAVEQGKVYKMEINGLNKKLEVAMEELKKADELRKIVHVLSQEKQDVSSLFEAQKKEHTKQIEAITVLVNELSEKIASFESRVAEDIRSNNLRLEHSQYQLTSHIKKVNTLARKELLYKQRLERRCSDLQMAEAEVDLLGDEVEALLSLLEKIYIALDHYSPILQHYPGIIEILKLVRRELSGEHTKSV
ncbi:hypothetical protein LguiA_014734 [Lonicera macranthoides]